MRVVRRIIFTDYFFGIEPKSLNLDTNVHKQTSILRSTEKAYYSKLLAEKRGDIKETWAKLNTVIHKQRPYIKYPIHINCGDKDISNNKDMANKFNKFFTNIDSKLAKKNITNYDGNVSICDYLGGRIGNCLYLKPADEEEVINKSVYTNKIYRF